MIWLTSYSSKFGAFLLFLFMATDLFGQGKERPALPEAVKYQVDYAKDIAPIFATHCIRCHGDKKSQGGLRLDLKNEALKGGDSGPAFLAGKSGDSRLIRYVAGVEETVMPPSGPRLSKEQVGLLRAWIDQGAKWPESGSSGGKARSDHWSFQPIKRPLLSDVKNKSWPRNAIDHFILARLEKEGMQPSAEADRATLIRRLSLDLTGLPPSIAEVDAFVRDSRPDAYEQLVERLLASPHFGERWGRHWLDAARYADSDGYNGDSARPIWKYRDWVIAAINNDMPFDQFVVEQLAGDLLPNATLEQKIATGFHRNTLFNAEGGNDPEEFRVERVVDRASTTGGVFLGLTVGCAECHEHKYDPISQREFYELYAFFNNAEEATLEIPTPEELPKLREFHAELGRMRDRLKALETTRNSPPSFGPRQMLFPPIPSPSPWPGIVYVHSQGAPFAGQLAFEIKQFQNKKPSVASTLVLEEKSSQPRATSIHVRGNFRRPGAKVAPNVPRVLPALTKPPVANAPGSPNRLDLARWLVARENPLTARVAVNRFWQPFFGLGLVETENDFGKQGSLPTHPELLDWLAREFIGEPGALATGGTWSMKRLHRLIVCSSTYRQASHVRPELMNRDPRNLLLARQSRQRLEAEIIRDVMLAASGLLANRIGGKSVFPYQPAGVMETRRSPIPWQMSQGSDRYRRGMYTHFWRTSPYPFMVTFDAPRSEAACTRRHRSNTPLQALMLLNDPVFVECARGLAGRVLKEAPADDSARIRHAFRLCLGREPSTTELGYLHELLNQQRAEFLSDAKGAQQLAGQFVDARLGIQQTATWTALARVLFNLDELITRE